MNLKELHIRITLVLLWIAILFNMVFADIFSIMIAMVDKDVIDIPFNVKTMMSIAGLITNISILMIIFAWVLPYQVNRLANIIASFLTIVYVVGGGSTLPHYILIGSIEFILLVLVIIVAIRWKPEAENVGLKN